MKKKRLLRQQKIQRSRGCIMVEWLSRFANAGRVVLLHLQKLLKKQHNLSLQAILTNFKQLLLKRESSHFKQYH